MATEDPDFAATVPDGPIWKKWQKVWCCPGCCLPCNSLLHPCRKAVSRRKKRFEQDGFDLDLVYLTDQLIVHGFPATGIEHLYRNPRYEVRRFLETRHKGHYTIYNFCCEPGRYYPNEMFDNRVVRFPFRDHCIPPLAMIVHFANHAKRWLDQDPANVVALHCKAGKGRAGLMSCVLLVRMGVHNTAEEAMQYYDETRVWNRKGLTVVSQRKAVKFYERLWREHWNVQGNLKDVPAESRVGERFPIPEEPPLRIVGVQVLFVQNYDDLRVKIFRASTVDPELILNCGRSTDMAWNCDVTVSGNFKITIERTSQRGKKKKFLEFWHNTLFINAKTGEADFGKQELDLKRRMRAILPEDIKLRLRVAPPGVEVREESDSVIGRVEVLDLTRKSSSARSNEGLDLVEMKTEAQL